MSYLLETNLVTAILKQNKIATDKFKQVKFLEEYLFISCITYYEIKNIIEFYCLHYILKGSTIGKK